MNIPTLIIPESTIQQTETIGIRPENLYEVEDEKDAFIDGTVRFVEVIGKNVTVHVNTPKGELVATELGFVHKEGDKILLEVKEEDLLLFDKEGRSIKRGVVHDG